MALRGSFKFISLLPRATVAESDVEEGENQLKRKRRSEGLLKKVTKRSALGDISNVVTYSGDSNEALSRDVSKPLRDEKTFANQTAVLDSAADVCEIREHTLTDPSVLPATSATKAHPKETALSAVTSPPKETQSLSERVLPCHQKSLDSSHYLTALECIDDESGASERYGNHGNQKQDVRPLPPASKMVAPGVCDIDASNADDVMEVADYAMEIFEYLKGREFLFKVKDYMTKHLVLNRSMRAMLVDWLVEIHGTFNLVHETLYMAVKIVDLFLSKVFVGKKNLQLVGVTAMFIACKFEDGFSPPIDEFVYACDNAYASDAIFKMEGLILKKLNFDLGMPLSYTFLRRYGKCAKLTMPQLTLARYILELSLMEYDMIFITESKLAAASLLLALKMQDLGGWTPTLEYYSGYQLDDLMDICMKLNDMLYERSKTPPNMVYSKYSDTVFFAVAKIPLLSMNISFGS